MGIIQNIEDYFVRRNARSGRNFGSITTGRAITINTQTAEDIFGIYRDCSIVFGIVNDIRDAIKDTPIWVSDVNGHRLDSPNAKQFKNLIRKPNVYGITNFASDIAFELIVFGRCIIYKKASSVNGYQYFIIKNQDITNIKYKASAFSEREIASVKYNKRKDNGSTSEEIKTNLFELVYSTAPDSILNNSDVLDDFVCPIVAARSNIEGLANMTDALNESYADGGARKIISFKNGDGSYSYAKTILPDEEDELHKNLKKYGRNKEDRKYIVTKQEVSVADLSLPTNQLDVQSSKPAFELSICNAFKYPPQLLAIKSGAYKSQSEAERAFYIRCVSPIANYIFNQLDFIFGTNIEGKIELDYSELTFFQEDKTKKGSAILTFMQGATQAVEMGAMTIAEVTTEIENIL